MSDLALVLRTDAENPELADLKLVNGQFVIVDGIDAIAQQIFVQFNWFRGEWFLDTRLGVPYFEQILKKGASVRIVGQIFRQLILRTPGVTGLAKFVFKVDRATRDATLEFEALTAFGTIVSSDYADFIIGGS